MRLVASIFFSLVLLSTLPNLAFGQESEADYSQQQSKYQYRIQPTQDAITIDGELDENVWKDSQISTDFWYSFPKDNEQVEKEYQTEVMMTYDDRFIYVAAICYSPDPPLIQSLKRDGDSFWDGDVFSVSFDPVNEKNNGFGFNTNPAGVQYDNLFTGGTGRRDSPNMGAFNTAWNNKWQNETKVYKDRYVIEMAIPFKSLRYGENTTWGLQFSRGVPSTNSWHTWAPVPVNFMVIDLGYTGALVWDKAPKKTKGNIALIPYVIGSTFKNIEDGEPSEQNFDGGLDAKIAVTSNLNLDLTINPDFSQVDVDRQVTNLTTVNVRFPEQRIFFVENSDIFTEFGIPPMRPFFSRKLGLDNDGNALKIQYGARLTGNLSSDTRIGLMNLQTDDQGGNPGNNYSAASFNHRLFGRSTLNGYFLNRQAHQGGEANSQDYTRAFGLEFDYRSLDGLDRIGVGYGKSLSHGYEGQNDFYRALFSTGNRNWNFYTNISGAGNNYDDSMGFMHLLHQYDSENDTTHRVGYHHNYTALSYQIFPESDKINNHIFGARANADWTQKDWERFVFQGTLSYNLLMASTSMFEANLVTNANKLLFPFTFTDGEPLPVGDYSWTQLSMEYSSDFRSAFAYGVGFSTGGFYNGTLRQVQAEVSYRQQPWGNFGLAFEANKLDFPDPYGSTTLFLIGPEVEINFNKDLFWTTFVQYNTQRDNFNINSRFQWRFQPLSDLFIVYTDNYAIDNWGPKNRALVVKLNYWLNL